MALDPDRVVVLGGTTAISPAVARAVATAVPAAVVERVSGPDRYATSLEVVRRFWPAGSEQAFIATGTAFPDALSAVPLAAENEAPVVLSRPTCAPAGTTAALAHVGADLRLLMGGTTALATFVLDTPLPGVSAASIPPGRRCRTPARGRCYSLGSSAFSGPAPLGACGAGGRVTLGCRTVERATWRESWAMRSSMRDMRR